MGAGEVADAAKSCLIVQESWQLNGTSLNGTLLQGTLSTKCPVASLDTRRSGLRSKNLMLSHGAQARGRAKSKPHPFFALSLQTGIDADPLFFTDSLLFSPYGLFAGYLGLMLKSPAG